MTQLNNEQRRVLNADKFRGDFAILHQAAVGVIMVRTREPFRAVETLSTFAFSVEGLEFKCWSILAGWATWNRSDPSADPVSDNAIEPMAALKAIGGIGGGDGFENGVYCFMYSHLLNLNKNPTMIQCVKEYSKLFSETKRRLVLIMPPSYELPPELEDDVVILDFDPPSYAELRETYDRLLAIVPDPSRPRFTDAEIDRILSAGAGMVAQEFDTALSRALATHRTSLPDVAIDDIVKVVMGVKTEMVKKSEVLELMEAENMDNVGGLSNLKAWLQKRARCFDQEAQEFGIEPPRGIALIGPPGTGKSLVAKATAHDLGLPLVKFDVGSVFQSLVGQSEGRVRSSLKMVDAMAPCVLFIDEADKAFRTDSGAGDSGVGQRVLGAILTWLQESKTPVFVVITANRVDNLPSEFLRRGRLDEVFSVNMPSENERREVIIIHLRKRGKDPDEIKLLDAAVEASAGFVPAELEGAVKDAIIEAYTDGRELTGELIAEQLSNMKPLSVAFAEQFNAMATWAADNARPANEGEANIPRPPRRRTRGSGGHRDIADISGLDG